MDIRTETAAPGTIAVDAHRRPAHADGSATRALITAGAIAGPLFVVVGLVQALTREGFDLTRHPLSLLSLGDRGWVQIANFIVAGVLMLTFAVGARRSLGDGPGRVWAPVLFGLYGVGLVLGGAFTADPAIGLPGGHARRHPHRMDVPRRRARLRRTARVPRARGGDVRGRATPVVGGAPAGRRLVARDRRRVPRAVHSIRAGERACACSWASPSASPGSRPMRSHCCASARARPDAAPPPARLSSGCRGERRERASGCRAASASLTPSSPGLVDLRQEGAHLRDRVGEAGVEHLGGRDLVAVVAGEAQADDRVDEHARGDELARLLG